ncbi:hypothetical protein BN59_00715 [Legionella massiliensis]|uniref:Uncharacterized protein n=1 Tax=Legionella massiliensis TaxID=1034943 RepID=A0A078KTU0_9GAMM|nr:hypothetical protein [Legionella massiliensis]CDZ76446.1 hypothetical protein BN59_00715 [Legionella massiliensis]CEE12184.1 hypothetical protein BN1094_00715 [Legionella massiliensis]
MKNYINSINQKTGNRYYNSKKYSKALIHYLKGLAILETQIDQSPKILTSIAFCDHYVYALTDVLYTQSQLINQFVRESVNVTNDELLENLSFYRSMLTTITNRVISMSDSWENIRNEKKRTTKAQQVTVVYKLLAENLELLSDLWFATADELGVTTPHYERLLNESCRAMKLAIATQSKLPGAIGLNMHCGYLNLLERLYYFKQDTASKQEFLAKMKAHLERYQLLAVTQDNPPTQLELISYALLVDVKLHGISNNYLIAQGQALVDSIIEDNPAASQAISDFNKLVELSSHFPSSSHASASQQAPIQTLSRATPTSSSSSSEVPQAPMEPNPLGNIVRLLMRNPERIEQMVDKLYSLGSGEFSRLYPASDLSFLIREHEKSYVKQSLIDCAEQGDEAEVLDLLTPALKYLADCYLKQEKHSHNRARELFNAGKPWQKRAILLSLNIQTGIPSTHLPLIEPKRLRTGSTQSQPSQTLATEMHKKARKRSDSISSESQTPQLGSTLAHEEQVLAHWDQMQNSDISTLTQEEAVQTRSILKDSGFGSGLAFFASSSESSQGLNESHPKVQAFIHAMENIETYAFHPRRKKRLLANLLTIMGEFLEVNPDSPIKKVIAVVLSVESLYKTALKIYPCHEITNTRLPYLLHKHSRLFHDHHSFVLAADKTSQSDEELFKDAIESMLTDLETIYLARHEQLEFLINSLFEYITTKISQYNLMKEEDRAMLIDLFNGHISPSDACSSGTPLLW